MDTVLQKIIIVKKNVIIFNRFEFCLPLLDE